MCVTVEISLPLAFFFVLESLISEQSREDKRVRGEKQKYSLYSDSSHAHVSIGLWEEISTGAIFCLVAQWSKEGRHARHSCQGSRNKPWLSCGLSVCKRRGLNCVISKAPLSFGIPGRSLWVSLYFFECSPCNISTSSTHSSNIYLAFLLAPWNSDILAKL